MTNERSNDGIAPTRRQTLRATLAGAVSITAGTGLAAADGCDVTEGERAELREAFADPDAVAEALEAQEDLREALVDRDLVEGETTSVQVLAPLVDCEPRPEYRIFRRTPEGDYLTVSLRPLEEHGYATINPVGDAGECDDVINGCHPPCFSASCCHCRKSSCPGAPAGNHCCLVCNQFCSGGCRLEFNVVAPDPLEIDVTEGLFEEALVGG